MPVTLKCERCNRRIGDFPYDKVRDFVQAHGEICKDCLKREEKLIKFYDDQKNIYIRKMDKLLDEAKMELAKEVRNLGNAIDSTGE